MELTMYKVKNNRRGMKDEPASKGLSLFVEILLMVAVLTAAVYLWNRTQPMQKSVDGSLQDITGKISNNKYSSYDGSSVSGTEAINAIRMNASSTFTVTVKTTRNTTGKVYTTPIYNISDISDTDYIEPTARFTSTVGRTGNGTINAITLTQN